MRAWARERVKEEAPMLQYSLFDELLLTLQVRERRDPGLRRIEDLRALAPRVGFRRSVADALVSVAMKLDRAAGEELRTAHAAAR
jgi:hypothetical protein